MNQRSRRDYEMVIIGGGSAGLSAAIMSRMFGARTVLIERKRLGGECTFTGCIPSKTLLHIGRLFRDAKALQDFSISRCDPIVRFEAVMNHVRCVSERAYLHDDAPPNLSLLSMN